MYTMLFIFYHITGTYNGLVNWMITTNSDKAKIMVEIVDAEGTNVAMGDGVKGQTHVNNVKLWWPYSMVKTDAAYLYILKVC